MKNKPSRNNKTLKLCRFGWYFSLLAIAACSNQGNLISEKAASVSKEISDSAEQTQNARPNLLLIMADDLGYTDLGAYGSEIVTPNLDQLANDGLLLTDFHNQAVCAPTRAAIMSGTDNRNAGGAMHQTENQRGVPGYESHLNDDIVPLPLQLKEGGYQTYMAGKWHLGSEPDLLPIARGFQKSFTLMQGGASHYSDGRGMFERDRRGIYYENSKQVDTLPEGFYSSDFYTDYIINAIDQGDRNKPWFAFLAFTAPHWPLQVSEEYSDKYRGVYDDGYEVLRAKRIAKGKQLGVIPADAPMYPKLESVPDWGALSDAEKEISSRSMEIYAGMVDSLDENVGRLIAHLKATGEYDNTYIMFLSDNGAEGADRPPGDNGTDWTFDNSLENMGKVNSHIYYGAAWAQAGVGVNRYYKSYASEGGTLAPAIISHPTMTKSGQKSGAFASVVDIAPTFLDLASVPPTKINSKGEMAEPIQGVSMVPFVFGNAETIRDDDFSFGWEIFGHRAIRKGDWKLLYLTSQPAERRQPLAEKADQWGLYNMKTDPGEVNDLSAQYPEKVTELLKEWDSYVAKNGIVLPEP
ncbi:MAG: arylsulfatase [Acidiferrobacterales bacterium]|nr:arylsulfatase [Acidiferrobacterales bacterium]